MLVMTLSEAGQFVVGSDGLTESVFQNECSARIGGRLSTVQQYLLLAGDERDTLFVATTDVALRDDYRIGAGVIGWSDDARQQGIAVFTSLEPQ